MIFQDVYSSLNPRKRVLDIVAEPLRNFEKLTKGEERKRVDELLSIKLIVADEPVSALDLSIQAQVLNYMKDVQDEFKLSYLFISHDLGVVKHMCERLLIMHNSRFVEEGTRSEIFSNAQHDYTKKLIASIPDTDPDMRGVNEKRRRALNENSF
jgi:peptide/nickel transport system ATP-binding protein